MSATYDRVFKHVKKENENGHAVRNNQSIILIRKAVIEIAELLKKKGENHGTDV